MIKRLTISLFLIFLMAAGNFGLQAADCLPIPDATIAYNNVEAVWQVEGTGNMEIVIEHPVLDIGTFQGNGMVVIPHDWWAATSEGTITMSIYHVCEEGNLSEPVIFYRTGATNAWIGDIFFGGQGIGNTGIIDFGQLCHPTSGLGYTQVSVGETDAGPLMSKDCYCEYVKNGIFAHDKWLMSSSIDANALYYPEDPIAYTISVNDDGDEELAISTQQQQTQYTTYYQTDLLNRNLGSYSVFDYWVRSTSYTPAFVDPYETDHCEQRREKGETLETSDYRVSPNPTQGFVNVSLENDQAQEYTVYSVTGTQMNTTRIPNLSNFEIDLSSFEPGLYFVSYRLLNGDVITTRVVKQ